MAPEQSGTSAALAEGASVPPLGSRIMCESSRIERMRNCALHGHRHSESGDVEMNLAPCHLVAGDARTCSSAVLSSPLDYSRAEPSSRSTR